MLSPPFLKSKRKSLDEHQTRGIMNARRMIHMNEQELAKAIAAAYTKAESRWLAWRRAHPQDLRNGLDYSGSPEEDQIRAEWIELKNLFDQWRSERPAPEGFFWGISPVSGPGLIMNAKPVEIP